MHIPTIFHIIGALLCCVGLFMTVPLGVAIWYNDAGIKPFAFSMMVSLVVGSCIMALCKKQNDPLTHREGMTITACGWMACGLAGTLPYLFSGVLTSFPDAFFEAISGFTTTGATVFPNVEILPRSLLLWRALTHWLGGMGIIVFSLAILPFLGMGGMQLYKAEAPTPVPDKLLPRLQDSAMLLWKVYIMFSVLEFLLLWAGGMEPFYAVAYTFATMATGGVAPHNASVGYYSSPYFHWIITIFMFLAGANFALHFRMLRGDIGAFWRNSEFRLYTAVILVGTVLVAWNIYGTKFSGIEESMRYAVFHVVSICTTTGFVLDDYELWPSLSVMILIFLLFVGGCAGSTSGGVKMLRYVLLFKHVNRELFRIVHPRVVHIIKMGKVTVPPDVISAALGFLGLYFVLYVFISLALAAMGLDLKSAFSASIACLGNIGHGLGAVGMNGNYSHVPDVGKFLLAFAMVLGRLEVCTVFILFVPEFWRK